MSPKLRRLSGKEVIAILKRFGFDVNSQRGSHGERQTLTIAVHDELDVATLQAIFRQASKYIPADELRAHFSTD